jgi:hypothetical protein
MKRKCIQDLRFGFCDTEDGFYEIDPNYCDYFKALDTSLLLCNTAHEPRECQSGFLHQNLPDCFANVYLPEFSKLLRFISPVGIKRDFDFADWSKLLDFLHAGPSFKNRLRRWAQTLKVGPLNIVSAFQHFGITCSETDWLRVPATDENTAFFVGNKANVVIKSVPQHPTYVPAALLNVLRVDHLWLATMKLVAPVRCVGEFYHLVIQTAVMQNVLREIVYPILVDCGYMVGILDRDEMFAVAPPKTLYDNISIRVCKFSTTSNLLSHTFIPDQVCLTSPSELLYSANAKHQWLHGIADVKDIGYQHVAPVQHSKFPVTSEFRACAAALSTSKIAQLSFKYPRQFSEFSRDENIGFLRQQGFKVKTLEELQSWLDGK